MQTKRNVASIALAMALFFFATDSGRAAVTSVTPPSGALPAATVDAIYSQAFTAVGGSSKTTWMVSMTVPPGLRFNTLGGSTITMSGTPTTPGNYTITLIARDDGSTASMTAAYSLKVNATATPSQASLCASTPNVTGNLIQNAAFECATVSPTTPDHWNRGGYDDTFTFAYPVPGQTGSAAQVTITKHTDGDAKWYPDPIVAVPGSTCAFSTAYTATTQSVVTMQFTSTGNALSYVDIATLPATNTWTTTVIYPFVIPATAKSMTIFHRIASVGMLTIDNPLLVCTTSGGGSTPSSTALLSLRFDDGWQSQYNNALPILTAAKMPASFYIISDQVSTADHQIFPSTDNPLLSSTTTTTSRSVAWSEIYTDPSQHDFTFHVAVSATSSGTATVAYTPNGSSRTSLTLGTIGTGTTTPSFNFSLPVLAPSTPLVITLALAGSTGTLSASNPVLTESSGYMNASRVLALQAAGHEIGNHTEHHCLLETLKVNSGSALIPPTQVGAGCPDTGPLATTSTPTQEITGAEVALLTLGAKPVATFAYPYGSGAGDSAIESIIKNSTMVAASSTNAGYNMRPILDPYSLNVQIVDATVTFSVVQAWIDYAVTHNAWLILLFHQIETSTVTIPANGESAATTTALLQQIVNYATAQQAAGRLQVKTVYDAFKIMTQ